MNEITNKMKPALVVGDSATRALNVLILDDQETDRMRLKRICQKAGLQFNTYEAGDLAEFREHLDAREMDLVFLDYYLEMDTGLDALKILIGHEDQVNAIPIMITSVDRHDIAVEAMRSGCADYITKEDLGVETVRKAITSAYERRILIAAIGEAQSSRTAMRMAMSRLARTSSPEIRSILAATLRHIRHLRNAADFDTHVAASLSALEQSCSDINGFLDEIKGILDDKPSQGLPRSASHPGSV